MLGPKRVHISPWPIGLHATLAFDQNDQLWALEDFEPLTSSASGRCAASARDCSVALEGEADVTGVLVSTVGFGRLLDQVLTTVTLVAAYVR